MLDCGKEWESPLSPLGLVVCRYAADLLVLCIDDDCCSLCHFAQSVPTWLLHRLISVSLSPCCSLLLHFKRQPIRTMGHSLADLQVPQLEPRETSSCSVTPHRSLGELGACLCSLLLKCFLLPSLLPLLTLLTLCKSTTFKNLR